jgi:hypothetical protein
MWSRVGDLVLKILGMLKLGVTINQVKDSLGLIELVVSYFEAIR